MRTISLEKFFKDKREELELKFFSGKSGRTRLIVTPKIQKSGLIFAGIFKSLHFDRIQIAGEAEMIFFGGLDKSRQNSVLDMLCSTEIPCIIFAGGVRPPSGLKKRAQESAFPILVSRLKTSALIEGLIDYLSIELAERKCVHGVLMDIFGMGVLITGNSGIGKSECALDLITKGHRLVSDDVTELEKRGSGIVLGRGAGEIKHFMEIRGLGIINIKDLFGMSSIMEEKQVSLVVELEEWSSKKEYDRSGLEEKTYEVFGVKIPSLLIPVSPARNLSTLLEVAVRNFILKQGGVDSAKSFEGTHQRIIEKNRTL